MAFAPGLRSCRRLLQSGGVVLDVFEDVQHQHQVILARR